MKENQEESSPGFFFLKQTCNYWTGYEGGGKLPPDHQSVCTCLALAGNFSAPIPVGTVI